MRWIAAILLMGLGGPVLADSTAGAKRPDGLVLIVDRRADSISLFLSLPARDLEPVFGLGADALLDTEATVDIDLLYEGTFELADEIFASVETQLDGGPVTFEAMSMMVHDPGVLPPFKTPWDGETSIAVCTSPETVDRSGLDELQAYLGFFAWKVNGLAPLSLTFSEAGRGIENVEVREFWNMQHTGTRITALGADGELVLEAGQGRRLGAVTLGLLALGMLAIGILFLALHLRGRVEEEPAQESL